MPSATPPPQGSSAGCLPQQAPRRVQIQTGPTKASKLSRLEGPEVLECGEEKVEALKQRLRPNAETRGMCGRVNRALHLFKTRSTFGLLKKESTEQRSVVASLRIHPATPTFHSLILALLSFRFISLPRPPPTAAAAAALSRRNWVKLLVKRAYEKSGINVTSTAIYDESAAPSYRSVRAQRARQSANKLCLLVLAA